jgi:hypothetical protein
MPGRAYFLEGRWRYHLDNYHIRSCLLAPWPYALLREPGWHNHSRPTCWHRVISWCSRTNQTNRLTICIGPSPLDRQKFRQTQEMDQSSMRQYAYYNLCRVHRLLRVIASMEAGITDTSGQSKNCSDDNHSVADDQLSIASHLTLYGLAQLAHTSSSSPPVKNASEAPFYEASPTKQARD